MRRSPTTSGTCSRRCCAAGAELGAVAKRARIPGWALALGLLHAPPTAADPFEVHAIPGEGRSVAAEVVDADGAGSRELLRIVFRGYPPDERRLFEIYGLDAEGQPDPEPRFARELPEGAAAYDLADVATSPGEELLLLMPRGVQVLSLAASNTATTTLAVPGGRTLAVAPDERGLDRIRLVWPGLGTKGELRLLVPMLGETALLSAGGTPIAAIETGARANYLIPPRPGPAFVESDAQLYLDAPRLEAGDLDGDGRTDLLAAGRHELRIFLQRADGGFGPAPDQRLLLRKITPEDHLRGSGGLRTLAADLDGDGRMDLVLSHARGGLSNTSFTSSLFRNRGAPEFWALDAPDRVIATESGWGSDELIDLDGDGRPELLRVELPFSVLELIEVLVTRALDARVSVYRAGGEGLVSETPWLERQFGVPISLENGRPLGFVSNAQADLDGDGRRDLLASEGGEGLRLACFGPGGDAAPFSGPVLHQALPSGGRIRYGDLDADGRTDALLYDPRQPDAPLRVLLNRVGPSGCAGD